MFLNTLIEIGKQQSNQTDKLSDIIDLPKIETEDKKKNRIYNYVLSIILAPESNKPVCLSKPVLRPLDFNIFVPKNYFRPEVIISKKHLHAYDPDITPYERFNLKVQGGNNLACYLCVETAKLNQIRKSLFGKNDDIGGGEFLKILSKDYPHILDTKFCKALDAVFSTKKEFEENLIDTKTGTTNISSHYQHLGVSPTHRIVLIDILVLIPSLGIAEPTRLTQIEGFEAYLKARYFKAVTVSGENKICYATGELSNDIQEAGVEDRVSFNKMFVKTTKNYAYGFDERAFKKSYQVSAQSQKYLERGSSYLLDRYKVTIAGVSHCIIPSVPTYASIAYEDVLNRLQRRSDLLFSLKEIGVLTDGIQFETEAPCWINFVGFESDGNFFKIIHQISDVNEFYFNKVLDVFSETGRSFVGTMFTQRYLFNLYSIYSLIPLRKDKEKKNDALSLFADILERRPIEKSNILGHFKQFILCHKYGRYEAYKNIALQNEFDFALREGVFGYACFMISLRKLKILISMEATSSSDSSVIEVNLGQKINRFFSEMGYTTEQQALFFLGRMVNTIARVQYAQKHKHKPILDKLDYNGMDRSKVIRLYDELFAKSRQYAKVMLEKRLTIEYDANRFSQSFPADAKRWTLTPDETLFYILTGYSFYAPKETEDLKDEEKGSVQED